MDSIEPEFKRFGEADEAICAVMPELFYSAGAWYEDFTQTSDEEVEELLECAAVRTRVKRPWPEACLARFDIARVLTLGLAPRRSLAAAGQQWW